MMEKWHTAYQEALHVPVIVRFPPPESAGETGPVEPAFVETRQIDALTSHIDILPTILGLAGVSDQQRAEIAAKLAAERGAPPLPGVDLSGLLRGETDTVVEPDGRERQGVLFITDDEITAPLPPPTVPDLNNEKAQREFEIYNMVVDVVRTTNEGRPPVDLAPSSVRQPNHVRCVRTKDFKLSRYFDPSTTDPEPQEWEMYDLNLDPNEAVNLVQVTASPPTARTDLPSPFVTAQVQAHADRLAALLAELEARDL
jgi:arylsulfatase A-like enzyme